MAKRAGNIALALQLYTQAIDMFDGDHNFFHNRSAAYKLLDNWDMVLRDAQRCVDLSPGFPLGWCNVIQGYYYTQMFEQAKHTARVAPTVANPQDPHYAQFLLPQLDWLQAKLSDPANYPCEVCPVRDLGHALGFVYTNGLHLRQQQELLVVDVPTPSLDLVQQTILGKLIGKHIKVHQKLKLGDTFKTSAGIKVVALPVQDPQQERTLQRELMGFKMAESDDELSPHGVVLLRIVGTGSTSETTTASSKKKKKQSRNVDATVTPEQARLYIDAVVQHAAACRERYALGLEIGDGQLFHSGI